MYALYRAGCLEYSVSVTYIQWQCHAARVLRHKVLERDRIACGHRDMRAVRVQGLCNCTAYAGGGPNNPDMFATPVPNGWI